MQLHCFYDKNHAHASCLVGCQITGEAIVFDPYRNIEPYLETAAKEGINIVGPLETHISCGFPFRYTGTCDTYGDCRLFIR